MKNKILESSHNLFLKYGIREMSMQKLIEPLAISTKTFYKYYKNKEELLADVMQYHYNGQYAMLKKLPLDQNAVCLFVDLWHIAVEVEYEVNKIFYDDLHYYYPELEKEIEENSGKKFVEYFLLVLKKGIKEGDFRQDVIPEVVLESIFILFVNAVRKDYFKNFYLSAQGILLNIFVVFIRGLCTEKGIKALDEHMRRFDLSDNFKNKTI
jgi:AcrR family transcriptional regulator